MAKARITTKSGSKVVIEGSPEEVASLLAMVEGSGGASETRLPPKAKKRHLQSKARPTATTLLADLNDGGFFKKPKELSAIKTALEEQGHYYPASSLSPVVLRAVRKHLLRRIRDGKRWVYVQ